MTTRNGNFASFPFPQQYATAGNDIRAEYGKLRDRIYSALQNPNSVKSDFCKLLPDLFQLRMTILTEESISFQGYVERNEVLYGKIMRLKDGIGLDHLLEAIRFSMRVYDRIMRSLAENHPEPKPKRGNVKAAPFPNYDVFLVTLSYLPQGEILINWVHGSMFLELGLIAIDDLAQEGKPLPKNESLEELASLVCEAGQNFGASARQLGILPKKSSGNPIQWLEHISNEDLKEEHALSEFGLSEFAKNLQ